MFGSGDHIAKGRVHDDHTVFAGGVAVHIIDTDPCTSDHLKFGRRIQDFFGDFCGRTDRKPVILINHCKQAIFVFSQVRFKIDINSAISENLDSRGREFVRNKYFGGHWWRSF